MTGAELEIGECVALLYSVSIPSGMMMIKQVPTSLRESQLLSIGSGYVPRCALTGRCQCSISCGNDSVIG